ncbi:TonB C-terminal domain-containing protein [Candidatus Hydrogenosomobacter endosymbioticus]|uniref:Periplasmic protein TonB n=1 Tax=Candidatus Hydrogenosomobacter endosymbioticus TaxID=2558174 RepID=A0ABN6L2B3_9PROT|nr:TonB C-terminal domain-containing protein [Candidatus Hydrogenosomobacter endosymbioticus]BDB95991.1 hypothetical protein HYD_1240 [Candidatus Hydrogenosomobacter endosymbioticus]
MSNDKKGFLLSALFHALIVAFCFFGSMYMSDKLKIEEAPPCTIPIDVVAVSDISKAPPSRRKAEDPPPQEHARDPDPKKEEPKEKEVRKDASMEELIQKKLSERKEKSHVKEKQKAQDKKHDKKKITKKQPTKKNNVKKLRGQKNNSSDQQDFMRFLKDVRKDKSDAPVADTPMTDDNSKSNYGASSVGELSMSIVDRVRNQLESCWRIPLGAQNSGNIVVVVLLEMNPDATVRKATILHNEGTTNHPMYKVAAESALQAVFHPDCNPLVLPLDQYEKWKIFKFRFIR